MIENSWSKTINIIIVVFFALGVFFIGTRQQQDDVRETIADKTMPPSGSVLTAKSYKDLLRAPFEKNRDMQNALKNLAAQTYSQGDKGSNALKKSSEERRKNRAYAGAPPTIPHGISQTNSNSCRSCHVKGLALGDRIASPMSHELMGECTQCHVQDISPFAVLKFDGPGIPTSNGFVGMQEPLSGPRAFFGSPPVIPHSSWMRSNCASCHGQLAHPEIRSSHVERTSCTQCHVSSAPFDRNETFAMPNEPQQYVR